MKKAAIFVISALLLAIYLPAFAQSFPDVPTDHWAYAAVQDLADKGVIQGYPDGTFSGKRALTRYEFAQAISKAIPVIAKMVSTGAGAPGTQGEQGPQGIQGPPGPAGISPEELANIRNLINEFKDELAAQGVDIKALKDDVAALAERVSAVEAEQARVKITAEVPFIARGTVSNGVAGAFDLVTLLPVTPSAGFDKDGRSLGTSPNVLQNQNFFDDFELGIKGKVSNTAYVQAIIGAGNYLPFALNSNAVNEFSLYNLYLTSTLGLGPLGGAQVTVGRFPFQLTPMTLKFIAPDSYGYVTKLQKGDYALDGGSLAFKLWKANVTAFAADSVNSLGINTLSIQGGLNATTGALTPIVAASGIAGARATIGTPFAGNLGLTYYQLAPTGIGIDGREQVYGADLNATVAGIGLSGEYDQVRPSSALQPTISNAQHNAWNANLSYRLGNLNLGGGYTEVEANYNAPGYWSRLGRAANLQNVKGEVANISYAFTPSLSLYGNASFFKPKDNALDVTAREAIDPANDVDTFTGTSYVGGIGMDKITGFKTGVKYALTAENSVDLGWEQVQWAPNGGGGTRENYYSFGVGHTFNSNASLKLLYQIVDYKVGSAGLDPYAFADGFGVGPGGSYRGGVASAEFLLKY